MNLSKDFVEAAKLFKTYAIVGKSNLSAEKAKEYLCKRIPEDIMSLPKVDYSFKVKGTVGQGRTAQVPWVAVMQRSITTSTTRGVYIVYLLSADMSRLYLSLMLGCEYFAGMGPGKKKAIRKIAAQFAKMLTFPERFTTNPIRLEGTTSTNKEYELAHIIGTEYLLDNMPSSERMVEDLEELLLVYEQVPMMIGKRSIDEFYDYVDACADGLSVSNEDHFSTETEETTDGEKGSVGQHGKSRRTKSEDLPTIDAPEEKRKAVRNEKGELKYPRSESKAREALRKANYMCEYDPTHFSFHSKKNVGKMYVEAHHLIPLSEYERFVNSLDVMANIVSLCPNCHKCIHNGCKSERERIASVLFAKREERLKKAGIRVTPEWLYNVL